MLFTSRRQVSVLVSFIALIIAVCYNLIRIGMPLQMDQSFRVVGLALFFLNFPLILVEKLSARNTPRPFTDEYVILFLTLLISCLLGFLIPEAGSGYVLIVLGVLCFGYNLCFYFRDMRYRQLLFIPVALAVAVWLAIKVWNGGYLHPLFLEVLPFDARIHIDTLFHMSIAQMIKTYHIPSTGLNGLPFYHYHFGSHFVFAALSGLLKIRVVDFYQLGYPVIFLPLFLKALLGVPLAWHEKNGAEDPLSVGSWLIVAGAMMGVFPLYKILSRAAGDWNMFIVSESYNVSLIWMFLIVNIIVFDFTRREKSPVLSWPAITIVCVLVFLLGVTKVSTFFVFMAGLFYVALRLKLYTQRVILFSIIPLFGISMLCFWLAIDAKSGDGSVDFMHFFEEFVHAPFIPFIFIFYFWCIVLVVGCSLCLKMEDVHPLSNQRIFYHVLREAIIIVSIAGFLPGAILKIDGGSAGYFMDVSLWLSVALLLVLYPEIVTLISTVLQRIQQKPRKRAAIIFLSIVLLLAFLISFRNLRKSVTIFAKHSFTMRTWITGRQLGKFDFAESQTFMENLQGIKALIPKMDSSLRVNPDYQVLKKLYLMDSLDDARKSETVLLNGNMRGLEEKYPCYKYPFLIPSLTGIASSKSFVFENCYGRNYSFEYYKREDLEKENRTPVARFPQQIIVNIDSGNVTLIQATEN